MSATNPALLVEIDFVTADVMANPATFTWVDVTSRVRNDAPVTIQRGQNVELGRVEPGRCGLVLNNRDRAFDPDYTSGTYYPNVVPMRPIRISGIYSSTTYRLFQGFIESWQPQWGTGGSKDHTVAVSGVDGLAYLGRQPQGLDYHRSWVIARTPSTYTDNTATNVNGGRVVLVRIPGGVPSTVNVRVRGLNYVTGAFENETFSLTTINAEAGVTGTVPLTSITRVDIPTEAEGDVVAGKTIEIYLYPTYPAALSDVHVGWALDIAGWPSAARSLQTGKTTCTSWTANIGGEGYQQSDLNDGDSALSAIQRVVESESGTLFVSGAGAITFQNRHHRVLNRTSTATLGSGAGELPVMLERPPALDLASICNIARITPDATGATQVASDSTSITRYGRWPFAKGGLLISNLEAVDRATYAVFRGKTPRARAPQAKLVGDTTGSLLATMLGAEIGGCYTLRTRPPNVGSQVDQLVFLESIAWAIRRGDWRATWGFSQADTSTFWILGDATYGALGTTTIAGY